MKYQTVYNKHPKWYLIKDMNPNTHWCQWLIRDHSPTRDDVSRCQNMTAQRKNDPHERQSTSHRSTDRYRAMRHVPSSQDEPWPCTSRSKWRHPPGRVCIHMTHRTNTFSIFTLFHPNHLPHWCWQGICKTDTGTELDTWQQASIFTSLLWLYKALLLQWYIRSSHTHQKLHP